ncbi:MAG: DUF302 domain-containing protein [Gammaproteobacteria bacterium]|nr:DUF302 domain-containing protein [Gammaproteobacteria bacterium]
MRNTFFSGIVLVAMMLISAPAIAAKNPAFWKTTVTGDFDTVVANLKNGLETGQFIITSEEDLAKGLENNRHMLGGDYKWNTIGFKNVTSIQFCSVVFNHEVFNIDMDLSILCPFKVVAYNMIESPTKVTIITVKPTYLLRQGNSRERKIGLKIEQRIIDAINVGIKLEMPSK